MELVFRSAVVELLRAQLLLDQINADPKGSWY